MAALQGVMELYEQHLLVFVFVLSRVGGMLASAPFLSLRAAPMQARAFIAIGLALLLTPAQPPEQFPAPHTALELAIALGVEFALGGVLGLGLAFLLAGSQLTGELLGQLSGLQSEGVFGVSQDNAMPLVGQIFDLVTLAAFLLLGGHRQLVAALLDSFAAAPPGQAVVSSAWLELLGTALSESFALGVRMAAPVMAALLLGLLAAALVSRALPAINLLTLGYGLNAVILLGSLLFSVGAAAWVFGGVCEEFLERIGAWVVEKL